MGSNGGFTTNCSTGNRKRREARAILRGRVVLVARGHRTPELIDDLPNCLSPSCLSPFVEIEIPPVRLRPCVGIRREVVWG